MNFTVVETIGRRKNFLPWHRKPWSTIENPSVSNGVGSTTGGAYGTNIKIGELNAPAVDDFGHFSDTALKSIPRPNSSNIQKKLEANLEENAGATATVNIEKAINNANAADLFANA